MKITTKSVYALKAMLAMAESNQLTSIMMITDELNISQKYLEQIFRKLKLAGIIKSSRGKNGGYEFNRDIHHISVYDIIYTLEDDEKEKLDILQPMEETLTLFLKRISIYDLYQKYESYELMQDYII